jgi:TRAP transporter TAXI family solute receptor
MRLKRLLFVVTATALVAVTAGCGGRGGASGAAPAPAGAPSQGQPAAPAAQPSQPLPSSVSIGTNPAGTVFYAVGSGLAKVISDHAPFQAVVQPYTGTSTFIPLLQTGELTLGVVNAVDMAMVYRGPDKLKVGDRNPFQPVPEVRLLMRGAPLMVSPFTKKDSGIETVADLRGQRVAGDYAAHLAVWFNMFGALASCGLTWNDVQVVPVPAANDGIDALVQGRVVAAPHALGSGKVREADSSVGLRLVSICADEQGAKRLRDAVPGYYAKLIPAGSTTGAVQDGYTTAYDIYFVAHKNLPDNVANAVVQAIWQHTAELAPLHPTLQEWTTDRFVDPGATIPYHPGAIQFYKDQGIWTAEMDKAQQELLTQAAS